MWNRMCDLLEKGVLNRFVIGIMWSAGVLYMYVSGREVNSALVGLTGIILGYFFGQESQATLVNGRLSSVLREAVEHGQQQVSGES